MPRGICRQKISAADIRALIAFFETSEDMPCIEDVLHMVIRALSQKLLLASFLEQVNLIGGCHIFVNLLQRLHPMSWIYHMTFHYSMLPPVYFILDSSL